ncbi:hypothetical protein [Erythrobacter phage vB_EliS-L02]|nr:hypothetical protein [Erythrobacter phage vB_EliS-L02]
MSLAAAHEEQERINFAKFVAGTIGVVEATPCELSYVYTRCKETGRHWVEDPQGWSMQVGYLGLRPVVISLRAITIDGHKLIFYHATSTVVDWDMIRSWLKANMPDSVFEIRNGEARLNATDADNWSIVFPRKEVAA